jgi:hypothetical protein
VTDAKKEKADYELETWARTVLIGTKQPSAADKVRALRVLTQANPRANQVRLAKALTELAWQPGTPAQSQLLLLEEAVAALRKVPEDEPGRAESTVKIMNLYQRKLHESGARAEGLAICVEMAQVSRAAMAAGERGWVEWGVRSYAHRLAEEGFHHESAQLLGAAQVPDDGSGGSVWDRLSLIAELEASRQTADAAETLEKLLDDQRALLQHEKTSLSGIFHSLMWHAGLLDRAGRPSEALAARDEAGKLLQRLAASGEPKVWGGYQYTFAEVHIVAYARDSEPVIPGRPQPPFGVNMSNWSPDLRNAYVDAIGNIQCQCRDTPTAAVGTLAHQAEHETRRPELALLRRRIAVRTTAFWLWHRGHNFIEVVLPAVDVSVTASLDWHTQDPAAGLAGLVRALIDQTMVLVAGQRYSDALSSYEEALRLIESLRQ